MRQLSCILIALAIVAVYGDKEDKFPVRGIPAKIEDYPYYVSIRDHNYHMCVGNIIDKQYILTAADCVVPIDPADTQEDLRQRLIVVTGTTYLNSGGDTYKVEKLWKHENYDSELPRSNHNIALIKLTLPIQFGPTQQPIKLPTRDITANDSVTTAAWGSRDWRYPKQNNLQKCDARVILPKICQMYHQNKLVRIHKYEFCINITNGTGFCHGDSGSGLIRNSDKTIVGLMSLGNWAIPCYERFPDIYTAVNPYVPWIEQTIGFHPSDRIAY